MATRILTQSEVEALLPMDECIELMDAALRTLARGEGTNPLRQATWLPDRRGLIGTMPGFVAEPQVLGLKVVTVFPGNHGSALDAHGSPGPSNWSRRTCSARPGSAAHSRGRCRNPPAGRSSRPR
ncbi:MAG: hypothetical protein GY711_03895 [bacterium]|nr:hypothetical protein [bacterium]